MSINCGVDIIEINRIKETMEASGPAFVERVFTEAEKNYCESKKAVKYKSYAARFAAKEAVAKALGTGIQEGISWTDIEVITNETGAPSIILSGMAKEKFKLSGGESISISLSHGDDHAIAFAVIERKEK